MTLLLDTSVLIASLDPAEPRHLSCDRLLIAGDHRVYAHGLAETFSVLTGGRQARRLAPSVAARLIEASVLPYVALVHLTGKETFAAIADSEPRGVRGGAVFDLLHLVAARKAGLARVITLDLRHFQALTRAGDPRIEAP